MYCERPSASKGTIVEKGKVVLKLGWKDRLEREEFACRTAYIYGLLRVTAPTRSAVANSPEIMEWCCYAIALVGLSSCFDLPETGSVRGPLQPLDRLSQRFSRRYGSLDLLNWFKGLCSWLHLAG